MLALLCLQCVRGIRINFKKMYKNSLVCPLKCNTVQEQDSQEHILACSKLSEGFNLKVSDIFSKEITAQAKLAKVFAKLMKKVKTTLKPPDSNTSLPGASILDPIS